MSRRIMDTNGPGARRSSIEESVLHMRAHPVEKWSMESLRGKTLAELKKWTEAGSTGHGGGSIQRLTTIAQIRNTHKNFAMKLRLPTMKAVRESFDILNAPDGMQRRFWDVLIVLLVLMLCVTIPFEILVEFYQVHVDVKTMMTVMDVIFWLDMPVNMLGAFYEGTELVTDPHEILHHYIWGNPFTENRGWFWIDLPGNIPWEIFVDLDSKNRKSAKLVKLLKLPRLLRIGKLMKYMGQYVSFAMFIQHCLLSLFFIHVMSSWYLGSYFNEISCYKFNEGHGRRLGGDSDHEEDPSPDGCLPLGLSYIESMTSVVLMVVGGVPTVDSNPFHETGHYNRWLHLVASIFGTALYWTIQADLIVVMLNSTNAYTHHRVTLDRARQEVNYFELPEELKHKVVSAMEYQWKAMVPSRCSLIKDETLSPQLREEIVLHFHGASLQNTALFAGCSQGCMASAAMRLKTIVVRKFDYIIRRGELGRELYLLSKGRAAVVVKDTVVACIEPGNFFGETALVSKTNPYRTVDIVALDWCELQQLDSDDFKELCVGYPDVLANAEMMMALLEQDSANCSVLWAHYLKEKNRIFDESKQQATTTPKFQSSPSGSIPSNDSDSPNKRNTLIKASIDDTSDKRGVSPIYRAKTLVLETQIRDGSFRLEALRLKEEERLRRASGGTEGSTLSVSSNREVAKGLAQVQEMAEDNEDADAARGPDADGAAGGTSPPSPVRLPPNGKNSDEL